MGKPTGIYQVCLSNGRLSGCKLFLAEDFLEQWGGLGGGSGPDLYFFLTDHIEDAVQSFAGDVLVEIEFIRDGVAAGCGFDYVVILFAYAHALQDGVNDGSEVSGEIRGAGLLEVFGGSVSAPVEHLVRIAEHQVLEGIVKNLFGLRSSAFSGTVHADFEIVDSIALAEQSHGFAEGLKFGGKQNADGFVIEESIRASGERNGFVGAQFESLLESGDDLRVTEGIVGGWGIFAGLGGCAGAERQNNDEQRSAREHFHEEDGVILSRAGMRRCLLFEFRAIPSVGLTYGSGKENAFSGLGVMR